MFSPRWWYTNTGPVAQATCTFFASLMPFIWLAESLRTSGSGARDSMCNMRQQLRMPSVVLQNIQAHLDLPDLRLARLVCREWADELAGQVHSVQLTPELWQLPNTHQQQQLERLTATFWSFKAVRLVCDPEQPVEPAALQYAIHVLSTIPCLNRITVQGLSGSDSDWGLLLTALQQLASAKKLTHLELLDVALPSASGLTDLTSLAPWLRHLSLVTPHSNQLQQEHVEVLASLQQLQGLQLSFRATSGTAVHGPLALDPLGRLQQLISLEITYTGLPELAANVGFTGSTPLSGCTSLQRLRVSDVLLPSCAGLARLPALRALALTQLEPLREEHVRFLQQCTTLQQLQLDPLPLEQLPTVAAATQLQQLSVKLWSPRHISQHLPGDGPVAALSALTQLQRLSVSGPILVTQTAVTQLSATLVKLSQLKLHVALPDGTQGFQGFTALQQLSLKPHRARRAAHDGSSSSSLRDDSSSSICVWPLQLPPNLVELEGEDLWFWGEHADLQQQFLEQHVPLRQTFPHSTSLTTLTLRSNSLSREDLALPDLWLLPQLQQLNLEHPNLGSTHIDLVKAHCGSQLKGLKVSVLEPHLRPRPRKAPRSAAGAAGGGAAGRSGAAAAARAGAAAVAAPLAGTLDRLPSWGEAFAGYLGLPITGMSATSTDYSDIGAALEGSLSQLSSCSGLERLTLEVGVRQLSSKVKAAVSGLTNLRELSLTVATDTPAAAGSDLSAWLRGMRQLRQLHVQLLGPGGCASAQTVLKQQLTAALPGCEVQLGQL